MKLAKLIKEDELVVIDSNEISHPLSAYSITLEDLWNVMIDEHAVCLDDEEDCLNFLAACTKVSR